MIDIKRDSKSDTFILTKTDSDGFHRQINLTYEEIDTLMELLSIRIYVD